MILFFDEDVGSRLPRAVALIRLPGATVEYPGRPYGPLPLGAKDSEWLPRAGEGRWLVFSCNYHMLEVEAEFALIIQHKVGIVFAKSGSYQTWELMRMLIERWDWLRQLDDGEPRPFAYFAGLKGKPQRYDLAKGPLPPRASRSRPERPFEQDRALPTGRAGRG